MKIRNIFKATLGLWLLTFILFCSSCQQNSIEIPVPQPEDSLKVIESFTLKKADGTAFGAGELTVVIKDLGITATVPPNTDRSALIPVVTIKGKSIDPASERPQNFSQPVAYTVTALDGSSVKYVVTVAASAPPAPKPMVYVGSSDKHFYALDGLTGALVWKYGSTASFAYSGATYANGTVYVGGIDNNVYAFDARTGSIKWQETIAATGIESDAVWHDGTVYVGTNDDYLYALDAATGKEKWKFLTGGNVSASPVVFGGTVYFGSSDGKLYALVAATGQLEWSFQTGAMINQSGPALANGVVYAGSRDGYLYAVDADTGALVWKYPTNGISLEQSSPAVANGIVYIGGWYNLAFNTKGSLYAVDAVTGKLVWEKLPNTGIGSSPCVAAGRVFITGDDFKIHALDANTGAGLWQKMIVPNSASPVVFNGMVYVGGGGSNYFYALDASTGVEKWKFNMPSGLMTSTPLVVLVGQLLQSPGRIAQQ